jgi:hypothetical protein
MASIVARAGLASSISRLPCTYMTTFVIYPSRNLNIPATSDKLPKKVAKYILKLPRINNVGLPNGNLNFPTISNKLPTNAC